MHGETVKKAYLCFSQGQTLSVRPVILCSFHQEVPLIRAFACLVVQTVSVAYCVGLVLYVSLVDFGATAPSGPWPPHPPGF